MLIGGFATQVEKSLPKEDANIKKLRIIQDETSRLELLLTDVRDFTRPSYPSEGIAGYPFINQRDTRLDGNRPY